MSLSRIILLLLIVVFVGHLVFYYPQLPATIAAHFDAAGQPDDWMAKGSFVLLEGGLAAMLLAEFLLLPSLMKKLPDSMINIPNRTFWLAPERRAATFDIMRRYLDWLAAGIFGLFIVVNQLIFRANIDRENLWGAAAGWAVGAFLVFVLVWIISLIRKFKVVH